MSDDTTTGDVLLAERHDRVLVLTLNRPRTRNALSKELSDKLHAALDDAEADKGVGAVVLTGAGGTFCSGTDIKGALGERSPELWDRYLTAVDEDRIYERLPLLAKPVIAAVEGYAVGGGCALAVACDAVIAADTAQFGFPETSRGIAAIAVGVGLGRVTGRLNALDLLLTSRFIGAEEALAKGMATKVVPAASLREQAIAYASVIASRAPSVITLTKRMFRRAQEMGFDDGFSYARDVSLLVREAGTADRALRGS